MSRAPRPRWTDEEMALAADESLELVDVAAELGRSVASVKRMRGRLLDGWEPRSRPLTAEEASFIADHPEMTARAVAERLGVKYSLVAKTRRTLARELDLSFGVGPYDKDPHAVGGRTLLGKTCAHCGVLRGGAEFHKDGRKKSGVCRYCRSDARHPDDRQAREEQVRAMAVVVGVEYRAHHGQEYTGRDMEVLGDPTLTGVEKSARLGRTYAATCAALQQYGFSSAIEPRLEPRGVWVIDSATETSALADADREGFGKPQAKTHCKQGHEFTPETTYIREGRGRDCLTCRQIRNKARSA